MEENVLFKLKAVFPGIEFATKISDVTGKVSYVSKSGLDNNINIRLGVFSNYKLHYHYIYELSINIERNGCNHTEIIINGDVLDEVLQEVEDELITVYNSSVELLKLMGLLD